MNFQKTVLTISIVLLIVALIVFGSMLYTDKSEYPPVAAQCPDYWIDMSGGMGTGGYCINTKNLGKGTCKNRMNFNGGLWSGEDGLCNKNKWANACDLTWDGVTNNPNACIKSENDEDDLTAEKSTDGEDDVSGFTSNLTFGNK